MAACLLLLLLGVECDVCEFLFNLPHRLEIRRPVKGVPPATEAKSTHWSKSVEFHRRADGTANAETGQKLRCKTIKHGRGAPPDFQRGNLRSGNVTRPQRLC